MGHKMVKAVKKNKLDFDSVKALLDNKFNEFNHAGFIADDPVSVPHKFAKREDIEIAGLLAATIAWGNRKSIVNNACKMMELMDNDPYNFIMTSSKKEQQRLKQFVHRTFNGNDLIDFLHGLKKVYKKHHTLEDLFVCKGNAMEGIASFRAEFIKGFSTIHALKHVSDPLTGSAAKRLNMYLRWMVRHDKRGVDFGLWQRIKPAQLMLPLDVHTGNVARKLNLLQRKQNDARAVEEVTNALLLFDPMDPVKYDFALFGLGVFEKF